MLETKIPFFSKCRLPHICHANSFESLGGRILHNRCMHAAHSFPISNQNSPYGWFEYEMYDDVNELIKDETNCICLEDIWRHIWTHTSTFSPSFSSFFGSLSLSLTRLSHSPIRPNKLQDEAKDTRSLKQTTSWTYGTRYLHREKSIVVGRFSLLPRILFFSNKVFRCVFGVTHYISAGGFYAVHSHTRGRVTIAKNYTFSTYATTIMHMYVFFLKLLSERKIETRPVWDTPNERSSPESP